MTAEDFTVLEMIAATIVAIVLIGLWEDARYRRWRRLCGKSDG